MTEIATITQEILNRVKPEGKYQESIQKTIETLNYSLLKLSLNAEITLGGSFAKNTYLKGDFDCDMFVMFDQVYDTTKLSDLLESILVDAGFTFERVHGSRDYFQMTVDDVFYEIIPVFKINHIDEAQNITDCSPLHVSWFKKHVHGLENDIRIAKAFFKANRLYGAESHIKGFSGHVIDILIIHYGGFENLLKAAKTLTIGQLIDTSNHFKGHLNESKKSALLVIDPIQPERNAAASLSEDVFLKFKTCASGFLEHPSLDWFEKKPIDVEALNELGSVISVVIVPEKGKRDVVGAKVLKIFEYIQKQLGIEDFRVIDSQWDFDINETQLYFVLESLTLDPIKVQQGPPVKVHANAEQFKIKHVNAYVNNDILYADIKRTYTDALVLVRDLLKSEYVTSRCVSATLTHS